MAAVHRYLQVTSVSFAEVPFESFANRSVSFMMACNISKADSQGEIRVFGDSIDNAELAEEAAMPPRQDAGTPSALDWPVYLRRLLLHQSLQANGALALQSPAERI
jgi:hypothetical protein